MTEKKSVIKIAQIVGNTVTGGVPSCVLNYYRFIDKEKYQFDFYTYGPSKLDEEIKRLGGNIYYIPNITNLPKYIFALTKLLKENNYKIMHSHMTSLSIFPLFAGWLAGVKNRFCHAHSTTHKTEKVRIFKNFLKKFCTIFSTKNIACSSYSAKWMYGRRADNAIVLRNAIDTKRFTQNLDERKKIRKKWGADSLVIGHIGRFEYQKNHEFLLDIMSKIVEDRPDALLVLVGQGSLENAIINKISKLGLTKNVIIEPEINNVEMYYNGFDFFVLPSRYEGLPLVGVEAQAMNIPCVFSEEVTKEADITDNNLFLPLNDPKEWADAILQNINMQKESGIRVSEKGYDIRDAVKTLEELYANTL